jgi:hypothetical protein
MKKRILSLVAALALAATVVAPINAAKATPAEKTGYNSSSLNDKVGAGEKKGETDKKIVDDLFGAASDVKSAQKDLKPSGAADAKVNVVTGDAKDSLIDNGVKPVIKEFVKATKEDKVRSGEKCGVDMLRGIHYFDLTASQTGDVTFKVDDEMNNDAMNGDCYAVITHYTGNAADEDGITAQYCKISSAGKVTAHFNSFSPVAIIVTTSESAQRLVNTYSHSAGSDAGTGAAVATTATPAPTVQPTTDATAVPATDAAAKAAANGKGAASPKTSDNAYALYLILAVAAVAGTTLVATKKTR